MSLVLSIFLLALCFELGHGLKVCRHQRGSVALHSNNNAASQSYPSMRSTRSYKPAVMTTHLYMDAASAALASVDAPKVSSHRGGLKRRLAQIVLSSTLFLSSMMVTNTVDSFATTSRVHAAEIGTLTLSEFINKLESGDVVKVRMEVVRTRGL
jgi:hypothetical protein